MKQLIQFIAVALAGTVLLTGCGQKQETPATPAQPTVAAPAPAPAPAAPAATAPSTPPSAIDLLASAKTGVSDAMALANQGKYTEALALLQQTSTEVQSNPEAKKLIDDSITQIKKMMADAAAKAAADKVGSTLGGLTK